MEYKVVWLQPALLDLNEQVKYRAEQTSLEEGREFADQVFAFSEGLSHAPHRGRILPLLGEGYRELIYARKHRLVYLVKSNEVKIIAFIHTSQDFPKSWKFRSRSV